MKAKKIIKITLVSLLSVALLAYVVYAGIFLSQPDEEERCMDVELVLSGNAKSLFVNEEDIAKLLKNAQLYPKGLPMKDVDTKAIEETLARNEFISKVECYKSANGKLCIDIEQRVPVIFVAPDGKEGYFVDAQGAIIPHHNNVVVDMVVASGAIDEKYAKAHLAEFGQYLQTDKFWNDQIEQIYVLRNKKGEHVVELIPRVGDQVVYLGTLDDYRKKLHKLEVFYNRAVQTVGWEKYAKLDLEYDGQIICTKR